MILTHHRCITVKNKLKQKNKKTNQLLVRGIVLSIMILFLEVVKEKEECKYYDGGKIIPILICGVILCLCICDAI